MRNANFGEMTPDQLLAFGDSLVATGNYERALLSYCAINSMIETEFSDSEMTERNIDSYLGQANIYINYLMDYPAALKALDSADRLRVEYDVTKPSIDFWYGVLYMTIGEQNSSTEYLQKANREFQKTYEEAKVADNEALMHYAISNMLLCTASMGPLKDGRNIIKEYSDLKPSPDFRDLHEFNMFLCDVVNKEEIDLDSELTTLNSILDRGSIPKSRYYPYVLFLIAEKNNKAGRADKALEALKIAEDSIDPKAGGDMLLAIYHLKYNIYRQTGDSQHAADYYLKYADLREQISSFNQIRNLRSVELQKDVDALHHSLLTQENRAKKMRTSIFFISLILLVSCLIIYILTRTNRRLSRTNRMLFDKNATLLQMEDKYRLLKASLTLEESSASIEKDITKNAQKKQLADIIERILDESPEIWNPDFSASRLAQLVGCSATTLSLTINSQFGMNFHHLIAEHRIKEVCRRLNETDTYDNLSTEAIAESVGIKSRTTFTAAFKRVTGMTPSTYMKIARSKRDNT